ncbi:hypothetical protein HK101_008030 [Irineochytrium annulatum]|nr:hypothetical protein HK101_008030 [Irineochytrium annulatum]
MQVTGKTFTELLPTIRDAIKNAAFVAIDAEMTGLTRNREQVIDRMDTVESRYQKIRASAADFLVTQYGVCTFRWDSQQQKYVAQAFNFPIFPRTGSRQFNLHRCFVSDPSSLQFLRDNNFDFNAWLDDGIPYLNQDDEAYAREQLGRLDYGADIDLSEKDREYADEAMGLVHGWLQNSREQKFVCPTGNNYQKRIVHQEVRNRFNGFLMTSSSNLGGVEITRLTEEQREAGMASPGYKLQQELESLIGFRRVIEMISESKKPVVGHNLYLDLCHTFHKFHKKLPATVDEYKRELNKLFPTPPHDISIYDTKYLAAWNDQLTKFIPYTDLAKLMDKCSRAPFLQPIIAHHSDYNSYGPDSQALHEAGYDAYITGFCFLRMTKLIAPGLSNSVILRDINITIASNRLFLMRSDIPYFNVTGSEAEISRATYIHLSSFPAGWRTSDILKQFAPHFGDVQVRWIDDRSCFLAPAITDVDQIHGIIAGLRDAGYSECQVQSYDEFKAAESGGGRGGGGEPSAKKRKLREMLEEAEEDDGVVVNACVVQ